MSEDNVVKPQFDAEAPPSDLQLIEDVRAPEHLLEPAPTFTAADRLLRAGGRLFAAQITIDTSAPGRLRQAAKDRAHSALTCAAAVLHIEEIDAQLALLAHAGAVAEEALLYRQALKDRQR